MVKKTKLFASILVCILILAFPTFARHTYQTYGTIAHEYNAPPQRFPQSPTQDYDRDGILNEKDICPNTFQGEVTTTDGCTARQLLAQAINILPQEYDYRVRNVDRIPIRLTQQTFDQLLTNRFYKTDRSELSCNGKTFFDASLQATHELMQLSCLVFRDSNRFSSSKQVQFMDGKGSFTTSSGQTVSVSTGSGAQSVQVTDLGVTCDIRLRPLALGALIRVLNANELIAKTAAKRTTCGNDAKQRALQNIEYAKQNRKKGHALSSIRNYKLAWTYATSCNCQ